MQDHEKRVLEMRPGEAFIDASDSFSTLVFDLKYYGSDNFTGRPVPGYGAEKLVMTREAAAALRSVEKGMEKAGYGLKVFDAYRPQRAADTFMRWAGDGSEHHTKAAFYPALNKSQLVPLGYLMPHSSHSRGSTVDLTLIDANTGEELDMGTPFDFFDPSSWPLSDAVTEAQKANRMLLRDAMLAHGFMPLETEWWHFTLRDEPYPDTWFDFPLG